MTEDELVWLLQRAKQIDPVAWDGFLKRDLARRRTKAMLAAKAELHKELAPKETK